MKLTSEQQHIVDIVLAEDLNHNPIHSVVAVDACAGSGKTALLQELTKQLNPENGIYLCYNKAIADESQSKFPTKIKCSTSHSLAYQNTIKPYNLTLGSFYWKSIKERIPYEDKILIIDIMKEWCMSEYDKFDLFIQAKKQANNAVADRYYEITKSYFNQMIKGQIPITHDGYLKMYHMLLAHNKIKHRKFDILLGDEIGDLAAVTFEIMKLIPAKRKVLVGDRFQNIYTFNYTINAFEKLPSKDIYSMSQSFRCNTSIAKRINEFSHMYIDPNKDFIGIEYDNMSIESIAYISRNNVALIEKIIELSSQRIKYNLFRPANSIFELILILLSVNKQQDRITSTEYKYLQDDIDHWNIDISIQSSFDTPFKYLRELYGEEPGFKTAFYLIREYGPAMIFKAYDSAKENEKDEIKYPISIGTVFGTKGLEFDKVYILSDLNASVDEILKDDIGHKKKYGDFSKDELTTLYLYYVACSRSRKELINATHLPHIL